MNLSTDLVKILSKGGFKLTKFVSNIPEVLRKLSLTSKEIENVEDTLVSPDSSSDVFVLEWDHMKDTLVSRGVSCDLQKDIPQRTVLLLCHQCLTPLVLLHLIRYKRASS